MRLSNGRVALPAFVLQNELFESDISCIRIKVRQGHVFGRPVAVHLIEAVGGLIEPIIVSGKDGKILDGNRRLTRTYLKIA